MPRERIQHGKLHVETDKDATDATDLPGNPAGLKAYPLRHYEPGEILASAERLIEEPSLDVSWDRAGWVQVSIEAPDDWWVRREATYTPGTVSHRSVHSEVLTRHEINNMIRTLRRARDAAYGSDE